MKFIKISRKKTENGDFMEVENRAMEIIKAIVLMDSIGDVNDNFELKHSHKTSGYTKSDYEEDDKTAHELHECFMDIVRAISQNGDIYDFNINIAILTQLIDTKVAIEDFLSAAICVINLYIAYERSLHYNQQIIQS